MSDHIKITRGIVGPGTPFHGVVPDGSPYARMADTRPNLQQIRRERTPEQQQDFDILRKAMIEDPESTTAALKAAFREAFKDDK